MDDVPCQGHRLALERLRRLAKLCAKASTLRNVPNSFGRLHKPSA